MDSVHLLKFQTEHTWAGETSSEVASQNYLQISNKSFRVPMGILKGKIKFGNFHNYEGESNEKPYKILIFLSRNLLDTKDTQ